MESKKTDADYFTELLRVSKNQIIWGGNYFASMLPDSSCWIVWDKCNGDTKWADFEMAWTSFDTAARIFRFMWNGMLQGKSIGEGYVMQGNKDLNEKRIHCAYCKGKPECVELIERREFEKISKKMCEKCALEWLMRPAEE